ncbi:MAG: Nif3-like dinuclear metal center hexameric protein [Bacteroidetes bacterium]|nr:Nif3-like dinuclear metal center hexameric protein [Bacteroidota bacterium]
MLIKEIISSLEYWAPRAFQESYDNSGLLTGNPNVECSGAIISLDATEEVVDDAIKANCNLIISHHPILFSGLKSLTGKTYVERTIIKAIQNGISLYALHTNLDNIHGGVSFKMGNLLGLKHMRVLKPSAENLLKLVTYVPVDHLETVCNAVFNAGGGKIGNYDECSFSVSGTGTFRPNEHAKPFSGSLNKRHSDVESCVEFLVRKDQSESILHALKHAHPYEEVAYELIPLYNKNQFVGSGVIGEFDTPVEYKDLLNIIKQTFGGTVRFTRAPKEKINTLALCGGSGSFLLETAISQNADAYLSSDFKYHQFFDAVDRIFLMDIGHFEGEQFTMNLIQDFLIEKFPTFAARLTEHKTNPVLYY